MLMRGRLFAGALFQGKLFGFVNEVADVLGGWVRYPERPSQEEIEKERIQLGITQPVAKKLKKVFRLAIRKTKNDKELNKELFEEVSKELDLQWQPEFAIYLAILIRIRNNAIDDLKARNLLHALEVYELRRIEEDDIAFIISMLAAEIYA